MKNFINHRHNSIYDNGEFYDEIFNDKKDLEFWEKQVVNQNWRVLELCCGTGRITNYLFQKGIKISGMDNSKSMLKRARSKIETSQVPLLLADMRGFQLEEKFDLVFIANNSIGHSYTEEQLNEVCLSVSKCLNKGGTFLIDLFNPTNTFLSQFQNGEKRFRFSFDTITFEKIDLYDSTCYYLDESIIKSALFFQKGKKVLREKTISIRVFTNSELKSSLDNAGFLIKHIYGNYDSSNYTANSPRQIIVAEIPS